MVGLARTNKYIHERLHNREDQQALENSLFSYNGRMERHVDQYNSPIDRRILVCSDRPVYAATQTSLEPIIAQACTRDQQLRDQIEAVLTPVRQTAIKIEDIKCHAGKVFTLLTDRWVGSADEDERGTKRRLSQCADRVRNVYGKLYEDVYSEERIYRPEDVVDTSEASHAAADALIFMMRGIVVRSGPFPRSPRSLWEEFTQLDYRWNDPADFWTLAFRTLDFIQSTPDGLKDSQVNDLREIHYHAVINRPRVPIPYLLGRLDGIIQNSLRW